LKVKGYMDFLAFVPLADADSGLYLMVSCTDDIA